MNKTKLICCLFCFCSLNYDDDAPYQWESLRNDLKLSRRGRLYDFRIAKLQTTNELSLQNVIHLYCIPSLAGEIGRSKAEVHHNRV